MLSSFVQSHRPGPNHTCDQTANEDVIRNVHSVVSALRRSALWLTYDTAEVVHHIKQPIS
jgi:hypothetical protein